VRANGKALYPELFVNGITTRLNEAQATAVKLKIQGHHNLQSSLEVKKTRLEKAMLIQQAMRLQDELIAELEAENARLEAAFGREVLEHRGTKAILAERETGLGMIQRIAEAGGLLVSDREDMLNTYRRDKG
jgi:hypothetical protein